MAKVFIVVRKYADRRKSCLAVEVGNEGMVLATFKNKDMESAWKKLIGNHMALVFENDSIDCIDDLMRKEEE